MTWPPSNEIQPPADSRPLSVDELLPEQARSLREAQQALWSIVKQNEAALNNKDIQEDAPFARPDASRSPRVLLIDGGRGTGKSSLMLTLLDRLSAHRPNASKGAKARRDADEAAYATKKKADTPEEEKRVEEVRSRSIYSKGVAERVLCMPPLDFDPMPPSVPIVAWLLESLRGLVEVVHNNRLEGCISLASLQRGERVERDLRRGWSELIDAAVAAWENGPDSGQTFAQRTDADRRRLETLTGFGRKLNSALNELFVAIEGSETTCVGRGGVVLIPVDDADMQVRRSPELLHALRLLYHPRLVFILTANWKLLEETLGAYYAGQYAKLYGGPDFELRGDPTSATFTSLRPGAQSDISKQLLLKTFPPAHHFPQRMLSLSDMLRFGGWSEPTKEAREQLAAHLGLSSFGDIWQVSIREFLTQRDHWANTVAASAHEPYNKTEPSALGSPVNPPPIPSSEITVLATLSSLLSSDIRRRFNSNSLAAKVLDPLNEQLKITHAIVSPVYSTIKITDADENYDATAYSVLQGFNATVGHEGGPESDPVKVGTWYWYRYVVRRLGEASRTQLTLSAWNAAIIVIPSDSRLNRSVGDSASWLQPDEVENRIRVKAAAAIEEDDFRIGGVTAIVAKAPKQCDSIELVLWWLSQVLPYNLDSDEGQWPSRTSSFLNEAESSHTSQLVSKLGGISVDDYSSIFYLLSRRSGLPLSTKWIIVSGIADGPTAPLFRDDGSSSLNWVEHSGLNEGLTRSTTGSTGYPRKNRDAITPEFLVQSRLKHGPGGSVISPLIRMAERGTGLSVRPAWSSRPIGLHNLMTTESTHNKIPQPFWNTNFARRVPLQPCIGLERLVISGPPAIADALRSAVVENLQTTGAEWLGTISTIALRGIWAGAWGETPIITANSDRVYYAGPRIAITLQWQARDESPSNAYCEWSIAIFRDDGTDAVESKLSERDSGLLCGLAGVFSDIAVQTAGLSVQVEPVAQGAAGWGCPAYTTFFRAERARQYWRELVRYTRNELGLGDTNDESARQVESAVLLIRWVHFNRTLAMVDYGAPFDVPSIGGADRFEQLQRCLEPIGFLDSDSNDYAKFEAWAEGLLPVVLNLFGESAASDWSKRFPNLAPTSSLEAGEPPHGDHDGHHASTESIDENVLTKGVDNEIPVSDQPHGEADSLESGVQLNTGIGPTFLNSAPPRADCCIGRDDALAYMDELITELLAHPEGPHWLGIVGIDGIGKTNLVSEYAYRYGSRFARGIIWVDGKGKSAVSVKLTVILQRNDLNARQVPTASSGMGGLLVVVDGVRSLHEIEQGVGASPDCFYILTARGYGTPLHDTANVIALGDLSLVDSNRLFANYYVGTSADKELNSHQGAISAETSGHPASVITLALAGRTSGLSTKVFASQLKTNGYTQIINSFISSGYERNVRKPKPDGFVAFICSAAATDLLRMRRAPDQDGETESWRQLLFILHALKLMRPGRIPTVIIEVLQFIITSDWYAEFGSSLSILKRFAELLESDSRAVVLAHFGATDDSSTNSRAVNLFMLQESWKQLVAHGVLTSCPPGASSESIVSSAFLPASQASREEYELRVQVWSAPLEGGILTEQLSYVMGLAISAILDTTAQCPDVVDAMAPVRAIASRVLDDGLDEDGAEVAQIIATALARSYRLSEEPNIAWQLLTNTAAKFQIDNSINRSRHSDPLCAYVAEWAAVAQILGRPLPGAFATVLSVWSMGDPPTARPKNFHQLKYDWLWTDLRRGLDHLLPYTGAESDEDTTIGIAANASSPVAVGLLDRLDQPTITTANESQQPPNDANNANDTNDGPVSPAAQLPPDELPDCESRGSKTQPSYFPLGGGVE